jgi:hypothetical protein
MYVAAYRAYPFHKIVPPKYFIFLFPAHAVTGLYHPAQENANRQRRISRRFLCFGNTCFPRVNSMRTACRAGITLSGVFFIGKTCGISAGRMIE